MFLHRHPLCFFLPDGTFLVADYLNRRIRRFEAEKF